MSTQQETNKPNKDKQTAASAPAQKATNDTNNVTKNTKNKSAPAKTTAPTAPTTSKKTKTDTAPAEKKTDTHAPTAKQPQEKKSGSLLTVLALITGVVGTGLGVYNFDRIRNTNNGDELLSLRNEISSLQTQVNTVNDVKIDAVIKQIEQFKTDTQALTRKVNARLSEVEQSHTGSSKALVEEINQALAQQRQQTQELLKEINQLELAQRGLAAHVDEKDAEHQVTSSQSMAHQEIGYLLRMANYKITSEGDVSGATKLLRIADDKLVLMNKGNTNAMNSAIRKKITQLNGVAKTDGNAVVSQLQRIADTIPHLTGKQTQTSAAEQQAPEAQEANAFEKIGAIIASGIKYTPADPSKIDVSQETLAIEKRLLQADITTAKLAVRSRNSSLLSESLNSINASLEQYFAQDNHAQAITQIIATIEKENIDTVLPNLSVLVEQFEQH